MLVKALVFFGTLLSNSPSHATETVWVTSNGNPPGTGSFSSPFVVTNAFLFDKVMRDFYTTYHSNLVINLGPGTYYTIGNPNSGWGLKQGYQLIGSGMEQTFIKLANGASNRTIMILGQNPHHNLPPAPLGHGVTVRDLTIDSNYDGTDKTYEGISLYGNDCRIIRVRSVRPTSDGVWECFALCIRESINPIIEDCEVVNASHSVTCIQVGESTNGIIRDCRVINKGHKGIGINGGGVNNHLVIEDNYIEGCFSGFYYDWLTSTNVTIKNNYFRDVIEGIAVKLTGNPTDALVNCSILNNTIELLNDPNTTAPFLSGITLWHKYEGMIRNISIIGNTVRWLDNVPNTKDIFVRGLDITNHRSLDGSGGVTGGIITQNFFGFNPSDFNMLSCENVNRFFNFDLQGNPITF